MNILKKKLITREGILYSFEGIREKELVKPDYNNNLRNYDVKSLKHIISNQILFDDILNWTTN